MRLDVVVFVFDGLARKEKLHASLVRRQPRIGGALKPPPLRRTERLVEVRQRLRWMLRVVPLRRRKLRLNKLL